MKVLYLVICDPIISFLLDEVVVKDWCKRIFRIIEAELHNIYYLTLQEMKEALSSLLRYSVELAGMSNVLEVLESSFKGSLSAQFHDLHQLQECVIKKKQHMEMMIWCIKHDFLENVRPQHKSYASWRLFCTGLTEIQSLKELASVRILDVGGCKSSLVTYASENISFRFNSYSLGRFLELPR